MALFNPRPSKPKVRLGATGSISARDAPMLMVAWRLMTSGVSGVRVDASSEAASWIDSPSSPTT